MATHQETFHPGEQEAQRRWQTADLWDSARKERLLWDHLPEDFHPRIAGAPFFFLATSSPDGRCDCSFKGGGPGLIRIIDARRFAFPDFDGNGAFLSLGNILLNPQVGCLFIDFSDGARLRVNGRASVHEDGPIAALFPEHRRVVLVEIEQVVPNCPQHVPRLLPAT
jgi:hypothetical protein